MSAELEDTPLNSDGLSFEITHPFPIETPKENLSEENASVSVNPMSIKECVQESGTEYNVNDLVWGKVSGHPWWPGQIFESSAASRRAMKYSKRDNYLIGYFGDQTFAWNDVSRIKPFRMYFDQMENQSYTETFCQALGCALDEVSRRVECGLSCTCLPMEVQTKIKFQTVVNRGIRKELSQRDGGDHLSTTSSFNPAELIHHLKSLATSQCGNRLGFVVARAQLLAFNRWKGYDELPAMRECGFSLESDAMHEPIQDWTGHEKETATKSSYVKHKRKSEDNEYLGKKVKLASASGKEKTDMKTNTLSSDNKWKASNLKWSELEEEQITQLQTDDGGYAYSQSSIAPKKLFGIGERIQRAAVQLNGSSPVLKSTRDFPPLHEMLLKLSLAAKDPMNGYSLLVPFSSFFSDFRDSTWGDTSIGQSKADIAFNPNTEEDQEKGNIPPGFMEVKEGSMFMELESEEFTPTALILNFQDPESVPLGAELNKIFARFGPLDESQTEGQGKAKKSAKVVFKRRSDAESAFSNAGKYCTLGPSLISYRLHYIPTPTTLPGYPKG